MLFVLTPSSTLADGVSTDSVAALSPILITEVQTGSSTSGKDEFVELFNDSSTGVDIANWQLRYISASSTTANLSAPTQTIAITPTADGQTIVPADSYFVLHTASVTLPQGTAGQTYSYTLPAAGGSLVLLEADSTTCTLNVEDAFAWGTGAFGQGNPTAASSKDADYQRYIGTGADYYETYDNAQDFGVGTPTPATENTLVGTGATAGDTAPDATTINDPVCVLPSGSASDGTGSTDGQADDGDTLQTPSDDDVPPEQTSSTGSGTSSSQEASVSTATGVPTADAGLTVPQLTEILPNPAPPQADADDEFIELYNANDVTFDLSGFKLVVGTTTHHMYAFPSGTMLSPHSFTAFFSADTGLSLSNTGGQVVLEDPNGAILGQTAVYGTAKDGQAWALTQGSWVWTTTPTPNAPNAITVPATTSKTAKAASSSKKASAKTTSASSKAKTSASADDTTSGASLADNASPAPIHAGVLAFAALFALLYGAYEYRRDVANRFHQLRSYRNARREARTSLARRRSG